jgi:hypothetical protein
MFGWYTGRYATKGTSPRWQSTLWSQLQDDCCGTSTRLFRAPLVELDKGFNQNILSGVHQSRLGMLFLSRFECF